MFVYLITNIVNGKKYVGQHAGEDLQDYWRRTVYLAGAGYQGKRLLYRAVRKYGSGAFEIKPLVIIGTKWEMDHYEIGMIKALDTMNPKKGYNLTAGGGGSFGYSPDEETRRKMSESRTGLKMSEENRVKLIERNKGNKYGVGHKLSPEYLAKLRAVNVGAKRSDETRRKLSESHMGHNQSEETKAKRAAALKDRVMSEEHKQKISKANIGNGTGGHIYWHVRRGIQSSSCYLCMKETNVLPT